MLVVVLALGTLWSGYWVVGSIALQSAAEQWFKQQAVAAGIASSSGLEVHGFPNRFDLTISDVHLTDPVSGVSWDTPFAQVFSMTWKPWHLIAAVANSQTITTPTQEILLGSGSLKGSLVLVPGRALVLDRIVVVGEELAASSNLGWEIKASRAELATRQDASVTNGHEVNLAVMALMPDPALMTAMAGTSDLPPVIDVARVDVVAGFSAPIDRFSGQSRPEPTSLRLRDGLIRWGDMELTVKGDLVADANGFAEGQINVQLQNWRKALPPAVAMGLIKPEIAPTVERMMEVLAQQSGDGSVLDLPLVMKDGWMTLGPLPIGPAPRLLRGALG